MHVHSCTQAHICKANRQSCPNQHKQARKQVQPGDTFTECFMACSLPLSACWRTDRIEKAEHAGNF